MIAARVFGLLTLVGLVAAQAAPIPSGVPACLLSCSQASCPTNDLTCLCVTEISAITVCVLSNCSASDQATAASLSVQECAALSSSGSSAIASATSGIASAISSAATEIESAASSISSAVESAITSAIASASSAAAGGSASGSAAGGSAAGSAAASSTAKPAGSGAESLSMKAGAFLGLVGVLFGFFAL